MMQYHMMKHDLSDQQMEIMCMDMRFSFQSELFLQIRDGLHFRGDDFYLIFDYHL